MKSIFLIACCFCFFASTIYAEGDLTKQTEIIKKKKSRRRYVVNNVLPKISNGVTVKKAPRKKTENKNKKKPKVKQKKKVKKKKKSLYFK